MLILTINDGERNGKLEENNTDNYLNTNFKFCISNCIIIKKKLIINNLEFDLNNISIVIFNFNEDLKTFKREKNKKFKNKIKTVNELINNFKEISNFIKKYYPNIIIYNDPNNCYELGDKVLVYDKIKNIQNDLVKVPKYNKIFNEDDLKSINYFPVIIKVTNGSHTSSDTICTNLKDLSYVYNYNFKNKNNIFVVEFIDSYIDELKCKHSIRFMVTNNHIMEYHFRGSNDWNARASVQIGNKIKESDLFYQKIFENHKPKLENYFSKIHKIYGNGFFHFDIIYNQKENKYYVCEIGLKICDWIMRDISCKYIDKISFNKKKLKNYYYEQLLKSTKVLK